MPGFQFFLDYINESYDVDDDFDYIKINVNSKNTTDYSYTDIIIINL